MSLADRMKSPGPTGDDRPPDGWRARLDLDTEDGGYLVTKPYDPDTPPSHTSAIAEFGEDPQDWEVVKIRRSRWQVYDGRWLEAARIELAPRGRSAQDRADIEQVCAYLSKWRPRTSSAPAPAAGAFVVPAGDTQFGKSDGDGTDGIITRLLSEYERTAQRLKAATPRGKVAELVVLPWLGDCIEGIWSQGGALRMRLDLTPTEQVRVYRRLMMRQVDVFAHLAERLIIPVVPGNHDETIRVAGKMASTYDDSWAIEGASAVQDAVEQNPELAGRVEFRFPGHDQLTVTLDVAGTMVGMAHGHQFGNGKDGWRAWWNGQAGGRTPVGQADVLLAAHRHHLHVQDHGDGRLFLQIPALDGGSTWFRHRTGDASPSRLMSFWTRDGAVWGLDPVTVRPVS